MLAFAVGACGGDETTGAMDTEDTAQHTEDTTEADTAEADTADHEVAETCALGDPCDDGDPCTIDGTCDEAGACVGQPKCDDGLPCTVDACAADGTCSHTPIPGFCLGGGAEGPICVAHNAADPTNTCRACNAHADGGPTWITLAEGAACSDGDACTVDEICQAGACVARGQRACDTGDPCNLGSCDPATGCVTSPTEEPCDDGDPCTLGDTCAGGQCVPGTDTLTCDGDDPCQVYRCEPGVGCVSDPLCDDGDPCTLNACDGGVCTYTQHFGPCDDGNECTFGATCDEAGQCVGGEPIECDDDNECTLDSCHPILGCLNLFISGECDDGDECTVGDHCVAGQCFGAKTSECPFCEITPTHRAQKIVSLELMADGMPGSGLDVDGDPETCAPPSACGGGVDNGLALLAFLVNPSIAESIETGVVKWVVDLNDLVFDGDLFPMHVYDTGLTTESTFCDFQSDTCSYRVAQLSLDQDCRPYFSFDNAQVVHDVLVAGGTQSLISMVLPLQGGDLLSLTIAWAQVRATYTLDADGEIATMTAIIGGAVPMAQLIAAIEGLDEASLPIDKEQALELLPILAPPDIDLDGDGIFESVSLALRINTIPAIIAE